MGHVSTKHVGGKRWISAIEIYLTKFGFIEFGDVDEDVNIDHINMKKEL